MVYDGPSSLIGESEMLDDVMVRPYDERAEEAVIGSLLLDSRGVDQISGKLAPADFFSRRNRACYEAALALAERGVAVNQVTLSHELAARDSLEAVGGAPYLAALVSSVPTSVHLDHYANIVLGCAIHRRIIDAGDSLKRIGMRGHVVEDSIAAVERVVEGIPRGDVAEGFVSLKEYFDEYVERAGATLSDDLRGSPVSTGFGQLDTILGGGLHPSDLVILAARPSVDKSAFVVNVARTAAGAGMCVGVFSLEMSGEQIAIRLLSSEANVDSHRLRINLLGEAEEERVIDAVGLLSDLPFYIDDSTFQGISEIRAKARRLRQDVGLDLVIVDYLQLIEAGRPENRAVSLGVVSRGLKAMARDLEVPVLACSQLSRAIEQRPNHRPLLSDLRESESLEQDSDVVMFLHREDSYMTREEWEAINPMQSYPEGIAEVIVAKHRSGPRGSTSLYFRSDRLRFETPVVDSEGVGEGVYV